jgi:hypothetical protein
MKVISNIPPEKEDLPSLIIELIRTYNITKTVKERELISRYKNLARP